MDWTITKDINGTHTVVQRHLDPLASALHLSHTAGHLLWLLIAVLAIWAVFYFLPTLIARGRGVHGWGAVLLVNLLLGWTVIGWLAALVMALAMERRWEHDLRRRLAQGQPL